MFVNFLSFLYTVLTWAITMKLGHFALLAISIRALRY